MFKNKKILLIICLLSFIPVVYSTLFLGALKDPYGNIDQLPVAIVKSESNPVQDNLLKSELFQFKVETLEKAEKDLQEGNVYGVIHFEKNFHQKLTTFCEIGESPIIYLSTSEGLSYSTSKLVSSALNQFVSSTNAQLSSKIISKNHGQKVPTSTGTVIKIKQTDIAPIKNNAEAMAPYIFSLTLFVGGIFINQFILRIFTKKNHSFFSFWKKQYLLPVIISFVQVILLLIINSLIIKVNINHTILLSLFLFLVSATFSSIISAFNKLIPGIGSFIILLLTMLQTSSSGGAYTIFLSSPFFQKIHLFLPMTYSINGIRKLISLHNQPLLQDIFLLCCFLLLGQFLLVLAYRKHEKSSL